MEIFARKKNMTDKDLGKSIENAKEEIENLKNKEFKIFGIKVTAITIGTAIGIASSGIGALYGVFLGYQDYMGMKKKIAEYVSPDLSDFDKRLAVQEEGTAKAQKSIEEGANKTAEYTRDIKNDLRGDLRRLEKVVEEVERANKQQAREIDKAISEAKTEIRAAQKQVDAAANQLNKDVAAAVKNTEQQLRTQDREVEQKIKALEKKLNEDLKKALDNPLANK